MSDQAGQGQRVRDLTPQEVAQGLKDGHVVLVDVREPKETAVERFPGAVLVPLSAFDPATIPAPPGSRSRIRLPLRPPVGHRLACRSGAGL